MADGSLQLDGGRDQYHYWSWPASGVKAEVTLPAPGAGFRWQIDEIVFGYDTAPAAPQAMTIKLDSNPTITMYVSGEDPKQYTPGSPLVGQDNGAVVITLPAAAGATGYLNVQCTKRVLN